MTTLHFGSFLELEVEVQQWDTIAVSTYFVVPTNLLPGAGRHLIGSTTLSPLRTSWRAVTPTLPPLSVTIGFNVTVALTIDVARAIVQVYAKVDAKALLGKVKVPGFPLTIQENWAYPWPKPPVRPIGKGQIAHVVVVMMENRSFDNLVGWLYKDTQNRPPLNIPPQASPTYDGLEDHRYWCPANAKDINPPDEEKVAETDRVYAIERASKFTVPNPDPLEQFRHMSYQLFGTETPTSPAPATMKGFVVNYADAIKEAGAKGKGADPKAIMQTYAPDQVPVLTALATNFAICDRWFASVPCQTWPNRAFVHAGTSCGRVNNLDSDQDSNWPPDPKYYNTKTIFNVLHEVGVTWKVYADSPLPTLTRSQFITQLDNPLLIGHFRGFGEFKLDAQAGLLPAYSFLEPDFMLTKNDDHPPHDVAAGERFLYEVWQAVSTGAAWKNTLLVITCDEHGGCYDHVPPPWTAVKPDDSKSQKPFDFDRYGVRVPAIVVSPWVEPGTVFRARAADAPEGAEFDHTSILATLRDWQDLQTKAKAGWLKSRRIGAAPTLAGVLTRSAPRTDLPRIPTPSASSVLPSDTEMGLNDLQRSIVAAFIAASLPGKFGPAMYKTVASEVAKLKTVGDALRKLGRGVKAQSAPLLRAAPHRPKKTPASKRKRSKVKR